MSIELLKLPIEEARNSLTYYKSLRRVLRKYPDLKIRYHLGEFPYSPSINPKVNRLNISFENHYNSKHGHILGIVARLSRIVYGVEVFASPVNLLFGKCESENPIMFDDIEEQFKSYNLPKNAELWILYELLHLHQNGEIPTWNMDDD